jgi:hypothetical protein
MFLVAPTNRRHTASGGGYGQRYPSLQTHTTPAAISGAYGQRWRMYPLGTSRPLLPVPCDSKQIGWDAASKNPTAPPRTLQARIPRFHGLLQARIPRNGIDPKQIGWDEQSGAEHWVAPEQSRQAHGRRRTYLGTADEQKSSRWRTAKLRRNPSRRSLQRREGITGQRTRAVEGCRRDSLCFCPMAIAGNFDQMLRGDPYLVG